MFKKNKISIQICFLLGFFFIFHNTIYRIIEKIQLFTIDTDLWYINSVWSFFPALILLFLSFSFSKIFNWDRVENYKIIRLFIIIVSATILWEQFFLDYNYYTNKSLIIEKGLLLLSIVLIYFNPIFVLIFLVQSILIWQTCQIPLGNFHYTDIRPVFEILILFLSYLFVSKYKIIHSNLFIILALAFHASNYFIPGVAKIEISPNGWEWIVENELSNLFISSYVNGWLGFLSEDLILDISQIINKTQIPIQLLTILIHLGSIFLLYRKKITMTLFICFELLHFGIFLSSGIFFWAWILVNIGFIFLLKQLPKESLEFMYSKKAKKLFIVIVLGSPLYFSPKPLAWWDSNLNVIYDFIVTTENQEKIKLNRNDFSPYDLIFTQNRFYYTTNEKIVNNTYGAMQNDNKIYSNLFSNFKNYIIKPIIGLESRYYKNNSYDVFKKLEVSASINEIKNNIEKFGVNYFDNPKKNVLENFLKKYFQNKNSTSNKNWFNKIGAPYHIYDLSCPRLSKNIKIRNVTMEKQNIWWNKENNKIVRFNKTKILDVDVEEN